MRYGTMREECEDPQEENQLGFKKMGKGESAMRNDSQSMHICARGNMPACFT